MRLFQGQEMNHVAHILASIFLCGLWLPIWILSAISYKPIYHCAFCGYSDAEAFLRNPALHQQQQAAAERKRALTAERLAAMPRDTAFDKLKYFVVGNQQTAVVVGIIIAFLGLVGVLAVAETISKNARRSASTVPTASPSSYVPTSPTPFPTPAKPGRNANRPASSRIAEVISTQAYLRETSDSNGRVIDIISEGTVIEVVQQKGPWFKVKYGPATGWLHGNTIRITPN